MKTPLITSALQYLHLHNVLSLITGLRFVVQGVVRKVRVCVSASEECSISEKSRADLNRICVIREIKVVGDFINPPSMPLADPPDTIQASLALCGGVCLCVCVYTCLTESYLHTLCISAS